MNLKWIYTYSMWGYGLTDGVSFVYYVATVLGIIHKAAILLYLFMIFDSVIF